VPGIERKRGGEARKGIARGIAAKRHKKRKTEISRKADFLLRPVRPHYGGQVAPSAPLAMSARDAKVRRGASQ